MWRSLRENWDVVVLLGAFASLTVVATGYERTARQFPLVFLAAGTVFLAAELAIAITPGRYSERLRRLTTGLATDMDSAVSGGADEPGTTSDERRYRHGATLALLVGTVLAAYLFGFLAAVPLVTVGSARVVGASDWRTTAIATVVLLVAVEVLFGQLLGVPTLEGALVDWEGVR